MNFIYLACPYTHPDADIRNNRVEQAGIVAGKLMMDGRTVYSPITHGHALVDHLPPATTKQHRFWMDQCLPFMRAASAMYLIPMHGWRLSKGVQEELVYFHLHRKPIWFLHGERTWNFDKITPADLTHWQAHMHKIEL